MIRMRPQRAVAITMAGMLALVHAGAAARELVLVEAGASPYVIVLADAAEPRRIGEAAEYLQKALRTATGVELPIVPESTVETGRPAIYLGWSRAAREAGIDVEAVTNWSYVNRTVGQDVFLVGEDRDTFITPGPRAMPLGVYGSFKAVTAFLEDQAGVRFLFPGEYGIVIPQTDRLTVAADLDAHWSPVFDYLIGRAAGFPRRHRGLDNKAFAFANHLFGPSETYFEYGGHSYYTSVPADRYGDSNPEYFALIGGVRTRQGNHLCISNPEVQALWLTEMDRVFARGFLWVELEQTDGYIPCECPECAAIHPDIGERVWIVHRKVAEEARRRWPDRKVMMTSYPPTQRPPTAFDSFPDNVMIRITRYRIEDFRRWAQAGFGEIPKGIYTTNWLTHDPRMSAYTAVQQLRLFREFDVKGIYLCGGLNLNGRDNWYPWGLGGPGYYAFFKGMHDPDVDPQAIRFAFIEAAFAEAAAPMHAFFEALDSRMDHFWKLYRRSPDNGPPVRMMVRGTGDFETHFYPPRILIPMRRNLERAQEVARQHRVQSLLRLVDLEFSFLESRARVYHLYRSYRIAPGWDTLALVEKAVQDFRETRNRLYPDGKPIQIPGVPSPFAGTQRQPGAGGAPFNWDFDRLREHGVLPGVGMKRVGIARVDPIALDGRADKSPWTGITAEAVGQIAMGAAPSETRYKAAYDATHLYLMIESTFLEADDLDDIVAVGRDGAAWRQESVELAIDPHGTRRMYYHFIMNPAPNSTLERRFGYHEDVDHPLFQDFEWDWRGEWDYAVHVDRDARAWTAEIRIPFETLGVRPAQPGDTWTLNVARNQRRGEALIASYLWSPNIESNTFHDREAFGEAVFR